MSNTLSNIGIIGYVISLPAVGLSIYVCIMFKQSSFSEGCGIYALCMVYAVSLIAMSTASTAISMAIDEYIQNRPGRRITPLIIQQSILGKILFSSLPLGMLIKILVVVSDPSDCVDDKSLLKRGAYIGLSILSVNYLYCIICAFYCIIYLRPPAYTDPAVQPVSSVPQIQVRVYENPPAYSVE
jgi:hypothetical protein